MTAYRGGNLELLRRFLSYGFVLFLQANILLPGRRRAGPPGYLGSLVRQSSLTQSLTRHIPSARISITENEGGVVATPALD